MPVAILFEAGAKRPYVDSLSLSMLDIQSSCAREINSGFDRLADRKAVQDVITLDR